MAVRTPTDGDTNLGGRRVADHEPRVDSPSESDRSSVGLRVCAPDVRGGAVADEVEEPFRKWGSLNRLGPRRLTADGRRRGARLDPT